MHTYHAWSNKQKSNASAVFRKLNYEQLGVNFSANVKKTLLEARIFHEKAVKDRELFLRAETVSLRNRIEDLDTTIRNADDKRSEIMTILKDHGALGECYELQARLLAKKQKLSEILEKLRSE